MLPFLGTFDRQHPKPIYKRHADIIEITRAVRRSTRPPINNLTEVTLTDMVVADFRYSDMTLWEDYIQRYRKKGYTWKANETVLFISMGGNLARWIVGESRINDCIVFDTRKWRIIGSGEKWDEENLVYYAAQAGFKLLLPSEDQIDEVLGYVEVGDS